MGQVYIGRKMRCSTSTAENIGHQVINWYKSRNGVEWNKLYGTGTSTHLQPPHAPAQDLDLACPEFLLMSRTIPIPVLGTTFKKIGQWLSG